MSGPVEKAEYVIARSIETIELGFESFVDGVEVMLDGIGDWLSYAVEKSEPVADGIFNLSATLVVILCLPIVGAICLLDELDDKTKLLFGWIHELDLTDMWKLGHAYLCVLSATFLPSLFLAYLSPDVSQMCSLLLTPWAASLGVVYEFLYGKTDQCY